jgi:hypothetical protein
MKTYGYDYVFALAADTVNEILAANLGRVDQTIDYSTIDQDTGSTVTLAARLAPWRMVPGGQNSLINLDLPISHGSLTLAGGALTGAYDLSGVVAEMQVTLGWVGAGDRQVARGRGDYTRLTFDPDPSTDKNNPGYVALVGFHDPDKKLDTIATGILSELMVSALFANRDKVAYVFANVQPAPAQLASWLTPGEWQYYVSSPTGGAGVLCFLCMSAGSAAFPAQPAFDASALRPAANSVALVSQRAFFANVVLPAVRSTFPDGTFQLTTTNESSSITNHGGFTVGSVSANTYSLTASPAGDGLAMSSSGGGPLSFLFGLANLPDASYSWSVATVNPLTYDGKNISFATDPHPTTHQDHTIQWYDWVLLAVIGITDIAGLVSTIYDLVNNFADQAQNVGISTINTNAQAATGHAVVNLAQVIDWTGGGQKFTPTSAGMSEILFLAGNLVVPPSSSQEEATSMALSTQPATYTPSDTTADAAPGAGKNADTYGWDTAFAINFDNVNVAIDKAWPSVNSGAKNLVQAADDDPSFKINAMLGPWQLTVGGDGKNIRVICPVMSGVYNAGSKVIRFDGVNCKIVIEIGMQWVPNPGQFSFVISAASDVQAIKADLDMNTIDATLRTAFATHQKPLSSDATALVQKAGVEWLITDKATNFYIFHSTDKYKDEFLSIYQFEQDWANDLQVLAEAASEDEPAVVLVTIVNNPTSGIAADVFPSLLSTWFNANIAEFNHVFASLDLSPIVSTTDKYAWMKPTATSYAVTDQGTTASSVFGVLTMAMGNQPSANHQVSPYAIPTGAQAGFLISGPNFVQYMLLAGARTIFNDAPETSFRIDNDGLTVRNTADLVWGKFMMDDKNKGSVANQGYSAQLDKKQLPNQLVMALENINVYVQGYSVSVMSTGSQWLLSRDSSEYILNVKDNNIDVYEATVVKIAKGQFTMTLMQSYVEIQFIDLLYSYSSDFDVHVNYTEQVQLTLQTLGGKQIFWFDQVLKNLVVSVTKTKSAITREIVEGAVAAALALVAVAGPIIEGLSAGAEIGEVTEEGGEAVVDAEAFSQAENANPEAAEQDAENAALNAAEQSGGKLTNIKNAFATTKWRAVATLAALAGAVVGADQAISAIIEAAAKKQWENVPGFDDFANYAIRPYTWPNVADFTLKSATLAGSLQIGLDVTSS